jgi:hypothetical protein
MISLGLWVLMLGVSVVQVPSITQQTGGPCSPTIGHTGGNVTVILNCPAIDSKVLQRLNEDFNKQGRELKEAQRQVEEWSRKSNELYRQAEMSQDRKLAQESKALLYKAKLEDADTCSDDQPSAWLSTKRLRWNELSRGRQDIGPSWGGTRQECACN